MHPEVESFIQYVRKKHPEYFSNKKVLEVGSLDINGSIRYLFKDCEYVGIDLGPGKGVDLVVPIHEHHDQYDVVVSTEMLEHDIHWKKSLRSMHDNLKSGGLFMLTCAGPRRQEHGTTRTTPGDAPFTNDYYRNITMDDFRSQVYEEDYKEYYLSYQRADTDLIFWGIKK